MGEKRGFWPWMRRRVGREPAASNAEPGPAPRLNAGAGVGPRSPPGLEFRVGWKRDDPAIEADVKAFWARLNILPPGIDADERARTIVVAGYAGSIVVAASTAVVQEVPFLRSRLAMFRAAVGPAFARPDVFTLLGSRTVAALETWALGHPEEGVMGVLTLLAANDAKIAPRRAETGLTLAGFTENDEKIMVAWFDHALV